VLFSLLIYQRGRERGRWNEGRRNAGRRRSTEQRLVRKEEKRIYPKSFVIDSIKSKSCDKRIVAKVFLKIFSIGHLL
jgi:hypothetical protein